MTYLKFNNLADYAQYFIHSSEMKGKSTGSLSTHLDVADLSDPGAINLHIVATNAIGEDTLACCSEVAFYKEIEAGEAEIAPDLLAALQKEAAAKVSDILLKRTRFFKSKGFKIHRGILSPQVPACLISK